MKIKTENLELEPLGLKHFDTVCEYSLDIENTKYMMYLPNDNEKEVLEFLSDTEKEWQKERPKYYEFAVLLNDIHIGAVSVYFDDCFETGEFGWIINKRYHGKGYAAESAKSILEFCIKNTGIKHYIAHCDSENFASRRVMEKLGMNLADIHGGRKNRSSNEIRNECRYEIYV